MTSICDERGQELIYAGMPITEVFKSELGLGGTLGLLWFQRRSEGFQNTLRSPLARVRMAAGCRAAVGCQRRSRVPEHSAAMEMLTRGSVCLPL